MLERTGHSPSKAMLSGFSNTLSSQIARALSPCSSSWVRLRSARYQRNLSKRVWPHLGERSRLLSRLVPAGAKRLLKVSRGHWGIENRVHWVRDVTFDEDRSQIRTGAAPQVMAGLRNLVIALVRRAGHTNVAVALRRHTAHLPEPFALLGIPCASGTTGE